MSLTPVTQAKSLILSKVTPLIEEQTIDLRQACGRVLSEDVISPVNVPPQDNSAMDGYAIAYQDGLESYSLLGTALAGHPFQGVLSAGQAVRIMTGAPVPVGADRVEMQENAIAPETQADATPQVSFTQAMKLGSNIRHAGEDILLGSKVLAKGHALTPVDCGLLASIGIAQVKVVRPVRVVIFTTGDELVEPGQPLQSGQIYESNSYVLEPMLRNMGVDVEVLAAVPDEPEQIKQALLKAAQNADLIITCGGVSVGEADFTRQVIEEIGQLDLWKLAIKPGKPLAYGSIDRALFLGLPGNPVSAYICMQQIGLLLVKALAGQKVKSTNKVPAIASEPLSKRPGRTDYQRGIAVLSEDGELIVRSTGKQGSGILSSVSKANCLIILEQERGRVEAGERVMIEFL